MSEYTAVPEEKLRDIDRIASLPNSPLSRLDYESMVGQWGADMARELLERRERDRKSIESYMEAVDAIRD